MMTFFFGFVAVIVPSFCCNKRDLGQSRAEHIRRSKSNGQNEGYEDPDKQDLDNQGSLKDPGKVKLGQMAPLAKSLRNLTEQLAQQRRP